MLSFTFGANNILFIIIFSTPPFGILYILYYIIYSLVESIKIFERLRFIRILYTHNIISIRI